MYLIRFYHIKTKWSYNVRNFYVTCLSLTKIKCYCCVKCFNDGNYMLLIILCNQQQATDHSLRNTGLSFVPFLWCYFLDVKINGTFNPFQKCALKAAECSGCLKKLKTIDNSVLHITPSVIPCPSTPK